MFLKKIYHSAIFNSWFSNLVILFSSIIAIPIVITKLSVEEANVWFLFYAVVSLGQAVLFGFNGTFTRFIAYSYSGISIHQFATIKDKKEQSVHSEINKEEFSEIFSLMRTVYVVLASVFFLFLLAGGYWGLSNPISEMKNPDDGWYSWFVVTCATTLILVLGYFRVLLEGINQVALVQRILGLVNLIGLGFILIVLTFYPTLFSIVLVYQLVTLAAAAVLIIPALSYLKKLGINKTSKGLNSRLFKLVWDSAWKSGVTVIIANSIKHLSAILVAQWFSPTQSASFQFTKRLFDVLESFTMTTFQSRVPVFASLRAKGDLVGLKKVLKQTQWISYAVFLSGYFIMLYFGETVLHFINSNVAIGSVELIMLFSLATFVARWGGMTLLISSQANYVVEHINAVIVATIYFTFLWLGLDFFGVNVFPLSLFVALLISAPIIAHQVYPTMDVSFLSYEKRTMVPAFGSLILINIFYLITA